MLLETEQSVETKRVGKEQFVGFISVTVFCFVIALALFGLGITSPFVETLVISLGIGWSISGVSFLLAPWLDRRTSPALTALVLTPLGLALGLGAAGWINQGSVIAYFTNNDAALIIGVFFAIVGYLIFEARSRLSEAKARLAEATAIQEQQEKALVTAELKLLQAQIEPHFLFNTLSNIISLVHTDPDAAEKTLIHLTTLLRSSLDRTRQESTSLEQELLIVSAYLSIHEIRMPHRLRYRFEPALETLPTELLNTRLPPLLIQPLVENAIQHGIDPAEDGGELVIAVKQQDKNLLIEVSDTGTGIQSSPDSGSGSGGTGLSNVRRRLETLYGGSAELRLEENDPCGVKAVIVLPASPL